MDIQPFKGSGTPEDPFVVETIEQFEALAEYAENQDVEFFKEKLFKAMKGYLNSDHSEQ